MSTELGDSPLGEIYGKEHPDLIGDKDPEQVQMLHQTLSRADG